MIDLDRMEAQLAAALTDPVRARPRPTGAAPTTPDTRRRERHHAGPRPATAPELLERGLVAEADAVMAGATDPCDALTWTTMRALLDGRRDAARAGMEKLRDLARQTDHAEAWERYWVQRFWADVQWGADQDGYEVLEHCRERAYRFNDLHWWGNLTLALATMAKQDEAVRAFDSALALTAVVARDGRWLDTVTNLVEAAALLGDAGRVAATSRSLSWPEGRLVVVGDGVACKGSVDRYRGLAFAAAGQWERAGECFRRAESTHRAIGAGPLLARTLRQATGTLAAA